MRDLKPSPLPHGHGWQPDTPDDRDHIYRRPPNFQPPEKVDLRPRCPAVYNQLHLDSCTANAIASALQFHREPPQIFDFMPSRLFIWYNERLLEGTQASNTGAQLRDGLKSVQQQGVCPETVWPYNQDQYAVPPPPHAYAAARFDPTMVYERIVKEAGSMDHFLDDVAACLACRFPVVFGFHVYPNFADAADTGAMPMPRPGDRSQSGHSVMAVGYDRGRRHLIVRNSWGTGWGDRGYFYMRSIS